MSLRSLFCLSFEWPLKTGFTESINMLMGNNFPHIIDSSITTEVITCKTFLIYAKYIKALQLDLGQQIPFQQAQGTNIFQYCTCPAGRVTYNFHSSFKHMHLSFKSVCNREHKGVICNKTYKVPYITAKMIFTQLFSERSASHIMTTVNTQKMLVCLFVCLFGA